MVLAVAHVAAGHGVMGYTFGEIASIVAILAALVTFLGWMFNRLILVPALTPITDELRRLNNLLDRMSTRQDVAERDHEHRLDELEGRLNGHSQRIDTLEITTARHDEALKKGGTLL